MRQVTEQVGGRIRARVEALGPDPELLALVDGLTAHVLLGRIDGATALRAPHAQLDRLLPSS